MNRLRSNSLKLRLIVMSLLLTIIPVVVVGLVSYERTYQTMLKSTIANALQLSDQLAGNTELSFYEMERFVDLGSSRDTLDYLQSDDYETRTRYAFQLIRNIDVYRSTYRFASSVQEITIVGLGNSHFSERKGVITLTEAEKREYLDTFGSGGLRMVLSPQPGEDELKILAGAPIYQTATNDLQGVIVLELDTRPFTEFTQNARIGAEGYFSVADSQDVFLSDSPPLAVGEMAVIHDGERGYFIRDAGGREELVIYSTVNQYNWKVVGRVFMDDIMAEASDIRRFTVTVMLICVATAIALCIFIVTRLFMPLDKLKQKMGLAAGGDLSVKLTARSTDEIAQLNDSFNQMMWEIRDLMDKNNLEQENLKKSELRVLQAQINPHFLYNTLDAIIWLVSAGENDKAVEMVDALSSFFRSSLSKGQDFIRVSEEAEHVQSYLTIQKYRYHDILDYHIHIPAELYEFRIMKLMLQPLVENALYHGLKPKRGGGTIWLEGALDGDTLVFTVRDNGVGIPAARLEELQRRLADAGHIDQSLAREDGGYGLFNIQQRVRLYCPTGCGLSIESTEGRGTCVTLRITGEL